MKIGSQIFDFSRPVLMGIVNITPDSFSDGGQFFSADAAFSHIDTLIQQGADIIDIGAESTKPGADTISAEEEIRRLTPILSVYTKHFSTPLSLDTTKAEVAEYGLNNGVSMINDISGFKEDSRLPEVVGRHKVPVVLMHRLSPSKTMQHNPHYDDVIAAIQARFEESLAIAASHGVNDIMLDPGIGFGKTAAHNFTILKQCHTFCKYGHPVLMGPSRKAFIGSITNEPPQQRLSGTLAACVWAYTQGVSVFRVHDVGEIKKALDISQAIMKA
jgi:dihydropteroate synthase